MIGSKRYFIGVFVTLFAVTMTVYAFAPAPAGADNEPGLTRTEVVLGGTDPFSGPASAYGAIGKGSQAYFAYINDKGGVNGRKIVFKNLDDGYSPPQTVQLTHQLVEQDHVFAIFGSLGTASSTAIRPYLNQNGIPQLFVASGASTWARDSARFPWTIGFQPDYQSEALIYARNILSQSANAKIGVLYQNDDYGQDYLTGLHRGLGSKSSLIVKEASYEVTDPDVSSQIASLKGSGADTFFIFATPKFATQALVAAAQQSWHPAIYLNNVSASQSVMRAATTRAGAAATKGVISALWLKDPADPKWANDGGMQLYKQIAAKYLAGVDTSNVFYVVGMANAYAMVDTLEAAGKNPTRQSLLTAATHLNETKSPFLLPGIVVRTSPENRYPITQLQLARYDEGRFVTFGPLIDARSFSQPAAK